MPIRTHFITEHTNLGSRYSSVGTSIVLFPVGVGGSLIFTPTRPTLGSTWAPIQWVLGALVPVSRSKSCKSTSKTWLLTNTANYYLHFQVGRDETSVILFRTTSSHPCDKFITIKITYWISMPLWSSGQSSWLQIKRFRVWFPALPHFLRSSGSGTGSTQLLEWKSSGSVSRKSRLTAVGFRCADDANPLSAKVGTNFADKLWSLSWYSSLAD
jgi:hypothetical protein